MPTAEPPIGEGLLCGFTYWHGTCIYWGYNGSR